MTLASVQDNDLQEVEQQLEAARQACEKLLGVPMRLIPIEERAAMSAAAVRAAALRPSRRAPASRAWR